VQRPNGGFPLGRSGAVNSQSTAWAAQGMLAVGTDPASIRSEEKGKSALDYLAAHQAEDGHYVYSGSSDQTPVWVTGQVLAAVSGEAFPVPAAPRKPEPRSPSTRPQSGGLKSSSIPSLESGSAQRSAGDSPGSTGGGFGGGGSAGPVAPPPSAAAPTIPAVPGAPEGVTPESIAPEPASFTSDPPEGPPTWVPILIGLLTGGGALGGVIWLGRRFGW
jgi:hypothetical protein